MKIFFIWLAFVELGILLSSAACAFLVQFDDRHTFMEAFLSTAGTINVIGGTMLACFGLAIAFERVKHRVEYGKRD